MCEALLRPLRRVVGWPGAGCTAAGAWVLTLGLLPAPPVWAQAEVPAVTRLAAPAPASARAAAAAAAPAPAVAADGPPAELPRPSKASATPAEPAAPPRPASAFEQLATAANGGQPVLRLGSGLRPPAEAAAPQRVPPDYLLQSGDELQVTVWGSLDGHWPLRVDRAGRVNLPRVGPVAVAGRSLQALPGLLRQRLDTVFRDYQLDVAVTDPSPVPVLMTGFVERPGELVLPPLSTLASALPRLGIQAAGGSLRRVELQRDGRSLLVFDLYPLLAGGSRQGDRLLQPGDVLHVQAVGPQVAVVGHVNRAAVFEILPGETVADALRLAGGLSPVADRRQLTLERMGQRQGVGAVQLQLPPDLGLALEDGDVLRADAGALVPGPSQLRNKRVRISGEVQRPGDYLLPPGALLDEALAQAGGATPAAQLFGTALRRESVRRQQEINFERALKELESGLRQDGGTAAAAAGSTPAAAADAAADRALLARLRARPPEGRVVLDLAPEAQALPPLPLEDGDQIHVPARSQSVGVFGAVYNAGSFVHVAGRSVQDYLARAGGPRERADTGAVFVVRANGEVLAAGGSGWLRASRFESLPAWPGDTVFVPEQPPASRLVQSAKDWTQVLYQLGLGVAALVAVR